MRRQGVLWTASIAGSVPDRQCPHRGVRRHRARGVHRGVLVEVKLRDLGHGYEGFPRMHAWPPVWMPGGWALDGEFGSEGILVSVRRLEGSLSLRMRYDGCEHNGRLQFDPPPMLAAVEEILRANLGKAIRDLGDLEVQPLAPPAVAAADDWLRCCAERVE